MQEPRRIRAGVRDSLGWACLAASLLLLSTGVRVVRAGNEDPAALVSTDPARVEALEREQTEVPPAAPSPSPRPKVPPPRAEVRPRADGTVADPASGVVVLNTRGYNYGPANIPSAPMPRRPGEGPAN
jgi:hypothetical protein